MAKQSDDLRLGLGPAQPAPAPSNTLLPRAEQPTQGAVAEIPADKQPEKAETGTLMIGREISFVGEITACKRLVVDGMVEAILHRCQEVFVGERGFFKGQARPKTLKYSGAWRASSSPANCC